MEFNKNGYTCCLDTTKHDEIEKRRGPVPPLSESLGTHQRSKNAKLGGLLNRIRMSLKFEKGVLF